MDPLFCPTSTASPAEPGGLLGSARINWQVTLSDRYVSNPQPGIESNDFLFITGINVTFGPKN